MTDMLQKSENVAKNVANKNSQDLTKQLKKGELSNGYYWIRLSWGGMVIMAYHTAFDGLFELDDYYYDSDEISAVLAPVPTFDEWEQLQNWAEFTNDYHELREKLEIAEYKNAQLKEQINHLLKTQARQFVDNQKLQVKAEKAKDVVNIVVNIDTARQIKQLKELLKECEHMIIAYSINNNTYTKNEVKKTITKIDEALGEK